MPDSIFADGPNPAPETYIVPGSSEIVPLACQALFDGAGASGDFVPTLIFRDQAGNVIMRSPVETTVAAGGSAEVSWFPGVKRGGGATPSSARNVYASMWFSVAQFGDSAVSIPDNAATNLSFVKGTSSLAGVLTVVPGAGPFTGFQMQSLEYIYLFSVAVLWEHANYARYSILVGPAVSESSGILFGPLDLHGLHADNNFTAAEINALGPDYAYDRLIVQPFNTPDTVTVSCYQNSGIARNITQAFASAIAWPI